MCNFGLGKAIVVPPDSEQIRFREPGGAGVCFC
jgi:hypothetical protein